MTTDNRKAVKQAKKEYKKLVANKQGHERVRTAVVKHILSYKDRVKFNLVLN